MKPILVAIIVLASMADASDAPRELAIVGYLPSYRVDRFRPQQATMLTDLVLFSVEPKPDGSLDSSRITPQIVETVNRRLGTAQVRKLLTVGGWGKSDAFAVVTADATLRSKFIADLVRACDRYDLGGIDVDWEHPRSDAEHLAYATFLAELKQALKAHDRIVTVAVAPWQPLLPAAIAAVDRVHLMAYDNGGRHSTFSLAFDSVDKLLNAGVPPEKICLGIPFYGRPYEGKFGDATIYSKLVQRSKLKPHENEFDGVFFNGPELVARKVKLAQRLSLGGVMIWEIGQDVADPERSLLHAIHAAATNPSPVTP